MIRIRKVFLLTLLIGFVAGIKSYSQAIYRSKIAGNWNQTSTWQLLTGSDSDLDGVPDANDSVIIRCADAVVLTADAFCVNLTIQNLGSPIVPTPLALGNYTLQVSGILNGPNTTYNTNIISSANGRIKFVGASRQLFGTNWNNIYPANWRVEIALNPGALGYSPKSIKVGDFVLTSGNFELRLPGTYTYFDLKIDKGSSFGNGYGTLYIAPGCRLACMRCGQRKGDVGSVADDSTYCQSIDVYGELEVHGGFLSGSTINIRNGGKLTVGRANPGPMLSSPATTNFYYSPGSYLEYRNHSPISTGRTQTGAEIDQASAWNTTGPPGNTVSNLIVNNTPAGIRGNNPVYIEDTLTMTYGYFDNVDMSGAYVRYGVNGTLRYNCPTAAQSAAISHLSIEFQNSFGPNNLIIDNPYGVTLDYSRSIGGKLLMLRGKLSLFNSGVLLTMTPSSSVGAVSDSSFVNGKMAKTGATPFTFPIGKNKQYRPITVTPVGGTETYTAEYFKTDPNASFNTMSKDATLHHISRCEYWTLLRAGTNDANVSLSWNTYSCGVDSLNNLRVAQWDGTKWLDKNTSTYSGNTTSGILNAGLSITQFGSTRPLTLASATPFNPLPVELIFFDAKSFNNYILLNWQTASEKNSDYFQLEHSQHGNDFSEIGRVKAAGNSNGIINYSFRYEHPLTGISYYRLNEFDFDGTWSLTKTIVSKSLKDNNDILIFINDENLMVNIISENDETVPLNIFDINGREVLSKNINTNQTYSISIFHFSRGFYFAKIVSNGSVISQKFVF